MAVERLFLEIKQNIMIKASDMSEEATVLMRQGKAVEAGELLKRAQEELLKTSTVDEILPEILERFSRAGISRPPVEFLHQILEDMPRPARSSLSLPSPSTNTEAMKTPTQKRLPETHQEPKPILLDEIERSPLAGIITSKTRIAMLQLFFQHPDASMSVREIGRLISSEINAVRRELDTLQKAGIITEHWDGNRRFNTLDQSSPIYPIFSQIFTPIIDQPEPAEEAGQAAPEPPAPSEPKPDTPEPIPDDSELIDQFLKSPKYHELYHRIVHLPRALTGLEDFQKLEKALAGVIFEQIGYLYLLKQQSSPDKFILSPEETFELYRQLYPERRVEDLDGFGLNSVLKGVTVPDGLCLSTESGMITIRGAVEYKSSPKDLMDDDHLNSQLQNYTASNLTTNLYRRNKSKPDALGKIVREIRPGIPELPLVMHQEVQTIVCVPSNSNSINGTIEKATFEPIPLNSSTLRQLVNNLRESAGITIHVHSHLD